MRDRRTVTVDQWGNGQAGPITLHVQDRPNNRDRPRPIIDLFLPYAERAPHTEGTPADAVHRVTLYSDEARALALALLEMAEVAGGGKLWKPSDG